MSESTVLRQHYDRVLATSMVDLATLRGLIPSLAATPAIVYCHENQFAYPVTPNQRFSIEPQMVTLYSGLSASRLVFNSPFNRDTYLSGVDRLLAKMPDAVPPGVSEQLRNKSIVVPVPVEECWYSGSTASSGQVLNVVWNHRWEYDKGPQQLLSCVQKLPDSMRFRFHIVGQQFRNSPAEFNQLKELLAQRGWLGQWGYLASVEDYRTLLRDCHVVLSTSWHDFQGLSVLDAVACGCVPLVPDRLAYREIFDPVYRYYSACTCTDSACTCTDTTSKLETSALDQETHHCAQRLTEYARVLQIGAGLPPAPDIRALSWPALEHEYRDLIERVDN